MEGFPDSAWVTSGPGLPGEVAATQLPIDGSVRPCAINSFGQVTGAVDDGTQSRAFRFTPATEITEFFGTISGRPATAYEKSNGEDINDSGVIAGWARQGRPTRGKEDSSPWAVSLNVSGAWETVAAGGSSVAKAVNNLGVTVGNRTGVHGQGFVRLAGTMYALLDLVANPPADLRLLLPLDINDAGQICGEAVFANPDGTLQWAGGFILTPAPAP
jgi:hypothetical protein